MKVVFDALLKKYVFQFWVWLFFDLIIWQKIVDENNNTRIGIFFKRLSHNNFCGLRLKRLLFWQFCWSRLNHKINIRPLNFLRLLLLCLVRFGTFLLLSVRNQINSFNKAVCKIVTCMRAKRYARRPQNKNSFLWNKFFKGHSSRREYFPHNTVSYNNL